MPAPGGGALDGLAQPRPVSESDLALMRWIDEFHLASPFAGARMVRDLLRREGHRSVRTRVRHVMARLGIAALSRTPPTSQQHPAHRVDPYLLRPLAITRSNQVWAAGIPDIPMARGVVYRFAVLDWVSRRVLAWRLSNTRTPDICIEAVREALASSGTPDIFNTDQGGQFTSQEFTGRLKDPGIPISMDVTGCWRDHVFVERL